MSAILLDGRALAKTMREELRTAIGEFRASTGIMPALAVVQVAGDAASERYVRAIRKTCDDVGVRRRIMRGLTPDELFCRVASRMCFAVFARRARRSSRARTRRGEG